jgi:hypothetical protein
LPCCPIRSSGRPAISLSLNPWMGRLFDRRVNSENAF